MKVPTTSRVVAPEAQMPSNKVAKMAGITALFTAATLSIISAKEEQGTNSNEKWSSNRPLLLARDSLDPLGTQMPQIDYKRFSKNEKIVAGGASIAALGILFLGLYRDWRKAKEDAPNT